MANLPIVDEKTAARLRITLLDFDDAQEIPNTVTYEIHDVATLTEIRGATGLTPAGQIDIILMSADNAIIDSTLERERRRVTVKADYGSGQELNGEFDYYVRNLSFVA